MYATAQISLRATNIIIEQFSRVLGLGVNPEMVSITAANEGLESGSQQGHAAPRNTNSSGNISSDESRFENTSHRFTGLIVVDISMVKTP